MLEKRNRQKCEFLISDDVTICDVTSQSRHSGDAGARIKLTALHNFNILNSLPKITVHNTSILTTEPFSD